MANFGKSSQDKLNTCHSDLIKLFTEVVKNFDCTVICGERNKEDQDKAVEQGFSKTPYPTSKHNSHPSLAIDVLPCPVDWKDEKRMIYFAGYVKGIAEKLNIKIRWGGDWDKDTELKDETFFDFPHFELI